MLLQHGPRTACVYVCFSLFSFSSPFVFAILPTTTTTTTTKLFLFLLILS